jgi:hypothetical protein
MSKKLRRRDYDVKKGKEKKKTEKRAMEKQGRYKEGW